MNTGKVLLGILAGLAAGALLGILFAPEKGSDLRKKITKKGEDYADGIKDKFDDVLDDISDKYEKMKQDVSDYTRPDSTKPGKADKESHQATV